MLKNNRDLLGIAYFVLAPTLAAWQWLNGFSWPLYGLMLVIWIGIGVINHFHAHLPFWRSEILNRCTDVAGSMLQGHPTYVFDIAHNRNHHVYNHGPDDLARTYRFGGDHNHLPGHLLHPAQVLAVLYPFFIVHIRDTMTNNRREFYWLCVQYAFVLCPWMLLFWLDPQKALVFVLVPQLICLHWLLGANYLQHAHADGCSEWNFARNFTGKVNWLFFNIGFHTAHHKQPLLHWSCLPNEHNRIAGNIDPRLNEPSFFSYLFRIYVLSIFKPELRSRSLMSASRVR